MYEYENEGFYICADNIQDHGNVGNIFRTASAFELSGVILYKHCADPFGPKAIRGSVGQSLILPAIQIDELDLLNDMKKSGYKIYITESEGNISLNKFKFPKSTCIIFGNEGKGISKELREIADGVIQIPISKNTEEGNMELSPALKKTADKYIKQNKDKYIAKGKKDGRAEGLVEGRAEGEKLGIAKALLESAKRMIKKGIYSLEEIAENLDLPLNEVQALSAQMA